MSKSALKTATTLTLHEQETASGWAADNSEVQTEWQNTTIHWIFGAILKIAGASPKWEIFWTLLPSVILKVDWNSGHSHATTACSRQCCCLSQSDSQPIETQLVVQKWFAAMGLSQSFLERVWHSSSHSLFPPSSFCPKTSSCATAFKPWKSSESICPRVTESIHWNESSVLDQLLSILKAIFSCCCTNQTQRRILFASEASLRAKVIRMWERKPLALSSQCSNEWHRWQSNLNANHPKLSKQCSMQPSGWFENSL